MLWDAESRLAAMAHILLPHEALSRERGRPAKFSTTAVPLLVDELRRHGSNGPFAAKLVGGASMFGALLSTGGVNMGERNVVSVRRALTAARIQIAAEDVGGDYGRSVYFDSSTGAVRVTSIRHGERVL
jgi:chemotaxis protein CheD